MKSFSYLKAILILTFTLPLISCGGGSLTDLANNNLYGYEMANKTKIPDQAENGYKDLNLNFNDGEQDISLHGWTYTKSKSATTIVYLHGNATNIGGLNRGGILNALKSMNTNVVVIDYPSYGKSTGLPTMKSLTTSAGVALKWAAQNFDGEVILWGRSLGAGVAAQAVKNYPYLVDAYMLTSPWTKVEDLIKHHFSALAKSVPEEWMAANTYDTSLALKNSKKPSIIFHGDEDTVIPYEFGQSLYQSLNYKDYSSFITLDGYEHNDLFQSKEMWSEIYNFVN